MNSASEDQRLFKLILSAVASGDLSTEDYKVALSGLKSGKIVEVLESILTVLSVPSIEIKTDGSKGSSPSKKRDQKDKTYSNFGPDNLFNDVKRRKLTRDRLEQIIASVDREFSYTVDSSMTMRALIKAFHDHSTERQWKLLKSIVNGEYEDDPYFNDSERN